MSNRVDYNLEILALKDIANSLNLGSLPYKIVGQIITIKISDSNILKIWLTDNGMHDSGRLYRIGYKITVLENGNSIESGVIKIMDTDKILADCNDYSGYWKRDGGDHHWDIRVGKLGETDLADKMPNAIGELNTLIDFYAKR